MVLQRIAVRNPPTSRPYRMRATFPLPRGTNPSTLGNSFVTYQQYRRIARTRSWDIYEWMVWNSGQKGRSVNSRGETVDTVLIGDDLGTPAFGKKNPTVSIAPGSPHDVNSGFTGTSPRTIFNRMVALLDDTDAVFLEFSGLSNDGVTDVTERVYLTGAPNWIVRMGPLERTSFNHTLTEHFGGVHWMWTVTAGEQSYRLVVNIHNGTPFNKFGTRRPEVLLKSVALRIRGTTSPGDPWEPPMKAYDANYTGRWNQWTEWSDPALAVIQSGPNSGFYLLKPDGLATPTGKYYQMPHLSQRAWRLVLWPGLVSGSPQSGQDPGWGVGDWSGGGFIGDDLEVPDDFLAHVNPITAYNNDVRLNAELAQNINSDVEYDFDPGDQSPYPGQILFPSIGQRYGGPTGSSNKYKPFCGIKAIGLNERRVLLEHKILEMRHHSRSWTALYEANGEPVKPNLHLDAAGGAQWSINIGGMTFSPQSTQGHDQYGPWKDAGFNFSSLANKETFAGSGVRGPRKLGQCLPDQLSGAGLQQQKVNRGYVQESGWDNWDGQHRQIGMGHSIGLAWIDADPLSMLYVTVEAELANMKFWHGTGAAGQEFVAPTQPGVTQGWGREIGWACYMLARAIPFNNLTISDSDGDPQVSRADRWAAGTLRRFVAGSEMAQAANGIPWHISGGKAFQMMPYNQEYYVHQDFEIAYLSVALKAAWDACGDSFFKSTRYPGAFAAPFSVLDGVGQGLHNLSWIEATFLQSAAPAPGLAGTGYAVNEIVYVPADRDVLDNSSLLSSWTEAQVRIATVSGGVPQTLAVAVPGAYRNTPFEGAVQIRQNDIGLYVAIVSGGSGYTAGDELTVVGGSPITAARILVTSVGVGGVITGVVFSNSGRYNYGGSPGPGSATTGGSGFGATVTLTMMKGAFVYVKANSAAVAAAGNGYRLNEQLTVAGGATLANKDSNRTIVKVASIAGGGSGPGPIGSLTIQSAGKYLTKPGAGAALNGGSGSGATTNLTMSANGNGLRVACTWGTPYDVHGGPFKMCPIRKYPSGPVYLNRDEFTGTGGYPPRTLNCQSNLEGFFDVGGAAQEPPSPDCENMWAALIGAQTTGALHYALDFYGKQYNPPDIAGAVALLQARGIGTSSSGGAGAKIENWWPIMAALRALLP